MESQHDTGSRLAARLKGLRTESGLTLDQLASRSGVSRSMISLIERGESSPTAAILDRLAGSLGVTLASLFSGAAREDAAPLARRADQPVWRDPETGYMRRNLSPAGFPSPIELVEVVLPPGIVVAYDTGPRQVGVSQQIWLVEGEISLTVGEAAHALKAGDCLAMQVDRPISFRNSTDQPARYLVALTVELPRGPRQAP